MQSIVVPISICVVLPVLIVFIISYTKINTNNKRAEVLMRAIESNKDVDTDKLLEQFKKRARTPRELLNLRLLRGLMFSLFGVFLFILSLLAKSEGLDYSSDDVFMPMMFGGFSLAAGISYLVVYFITRKNVDESAK